MGKKGVFVFLLIPMVALAAEMPAMIRGTRALGMGNALTAVADDSNVFFYNPAGMVLRTGGLFNAVGVHGGGNKDFVDLAKFINDNGDDLKNFDNLDFSRQEDLLNQIRTKYIDGTPVFDGSAPNTAWLSGPIADFLHLGVGVFGNASGTMGFDSDVLTSTSPTMYYNWDVDLVPMASMAVQIKKLPLLPGSLGVGASVKYIHRGNIQDNHVPLFDNDIYKSPPVQEGRGVGVDFGALYQVNRRINLALSVFDFGGTNIRYTALPEKDGFSSREARTEMIEPRWNAGVAWTPALIGIAGVGIPLQDRLVLAADLKDVFNKTQAPISQGHLADNIQDYVSAGAEFRLWFLRLRGGVHDGYPSVGLGADFPFVKLDYAGYSDNMGTGDVRHREKIQRVALTLGFGGGNVKARERINGKN